MMMTTVIIQLILSISVCESSHFYGGTITWKPMNNTATGSTIAVMFTQSYQFRRSAYSANAYDWCNETIILNQSPKIPNSGQTLICITSACGNYAATSINEYCTDFSSVLDSSSGQISTIENIAAGASFCVAFQDYSWANVWSTLCAGGCFSVSSAGWSIVSCVDLTMRSDGFINTPPVATIISPIKVPVNTITNINIPVIDADGDYLKCRWGVNTSTINECGSICQSVPGGTIDPNNCILKFNSSGKTVGTYYAAAMMVEDFSNSTSSTPFSSVPIQFLILIIATPSCSSKPTINSTLPSCTALQVNVQFNFTLTIISQCAGNTIADLYTNPPLNMYKGTLTRVGTTNVWTIGETWIPTSNQLGSQVYCALATDSAGIGSNQYCLTFTVLPAGSPLLCPGDLPATSTTTTSSSTTSTSTRTTSSTSITSTTKTTTITLSTTTTTITSTTAVSTITISTTTGETTTASTTASPTGVSTITISTTTGETTTASTTISTTTISTSDTSTATTETITISMTISTTIISTSDTSTATTETTTISMTTSTTVTSNNTSITTTVITTSTTSKTGNKSINPWLIVLSVLGFLALCTLCCCCWWWLFYGAGRRRRRQQSQEEKVKDEYLIPKKYHSKKFSASILKNLRRSTKVTRISVIELQNPSLIGRRATIMNSSECPSYESCVGTTLPGENIDAEPCRRKSLGNVSVTHVNRLQKPLPTDEKKQIELPIDNNNDITNMNSRKISIAKLPQNITVSKVQRSKSLTPNLETIKTRQSNLSIGQNKIDSLPAAKRNSLVYVSKVKRSSVSTNDMSQSFNKAPVARASRIVIAPKRLSSIHDQDQKSTELSSRRTSVNNGNVTVTKVART